MLVESIEELDPKLHCSSLRDMRILDEAKVGVWTDRIANQPDVSPKSSILVASTSGDPRIAIRVDKGFRIEISIGKWIEVPRSLSRGIDWDSRLETEAETWAIAR